jgi:hypothetical protein
MTEAYSSPPVTQLLHAWRAGDEAALDQLLPLVQVELHSLAQRMMSRETPGHTWQTTELVHEAYLRLAGQPASATPFGRIAPISLPSLLR